MSIIKKTHLEITCPSLSPPLNGRFLNSPQLFFGSIVSLRCNEGYFSFGERTVRCEDSDNNGNGTWNNTLSDCSCKSLLVDSSFTQHKNQNNCSKLPFSDILSTSDSSSKWKV